MEHTIELDPALVPTSIPVASTSQGKRAAEDDGDAPPPSKSKRMKLAPGELSKTDTNALAKLHELKLKSSDEDILASVWMTAPVLRAFSAEHPSLQPRLGVWNKTEVAQLKQAVTDYCAKRGITESTFAHIIHGMESETTTAVEGRKKRRGSEDDTLFRDIAAKVPRRPVSTVRDRLRRDYHPHNGAGPWTPAADARLVELVGELGQKWKAIGEEMRRRSVDCRDRYVNYVGKANRNTGTWLSEEDEALRVAVTKIAVETGLKADQPDFPWPRVSSELDNKRTRLQCRERWIEGLKGGDGHGGHSEQSLKAKKNKTPRALKAPANVAAAAAAAAALKPPGADPFAPPFSNAFTAADNLYLICLLESAGADHLMSIDWELVSRSLNNGRWSGNECCQQFLHLDHQLHGRFAPAATAAGPPNLSAVLAELKAAHETSVERDFLGQLVAD